MSKPELVWVGMPGSIAVVGTGTSAEDVIGHTIGLPNGFAVGLAMPKIDPEAIRALRRAAAGPAESVAEAFPTTLNHQNVEVLLLTPTTLMELIRTGTLGTFPETDEMALPE